MNCLANTPSNPSLNVTPILQSLMANAEKNAGKVSTQRRHDTIMKQFSTLLLIYCGSMSYQLIQANMPEALPSLRLVQNIIHTQYKHINEGVFRFDDALAHLIRHKAVLNITVSEDATRITSRIDYDVRSDRCIGFVLPLDKNGLPRTDAYVANSFEDIQDYFHKAAISKYAYVYTIQPLQEGVPSFCLACIGTDNKFTAEEILQRWQYIHSEFYKRGVTVVNFAADGDSRLLKAMRVALHFTNSANVHFSPNKTTLNKPLFENWLDTKLCPVVCIQDMVHIGVKFKSRLLKPAILLPMGSFIVSSTHLSMLTSIYGKDVHGLRAKDLDHHDKQNFAAVERIIRAAPLLQNMSDALGTKCYIEIMESALYSYLNKTYSPDKRLEEIWFATFVLRYWREWIRTNPSFTLQNNFITTNAYLCVEINAHSLLSSIIHNRERGINEHIVPWLMGSQSCEQMFRSLRSMTGNFSTIINFSMQGLLQRLHKLAVKDEIEAEDTGIKLPRAEKHQRKIGHGHDIHHSNEVQDEVIYKAMKNAECRAKETVTLLGMDRDLKSKGLWETPPIVENLFNHSEEHEEEENEDNEAPWCVDSPADIHLSDNVLLVLKQKKRKTNFENCNNYDAMQYCIHKNELWVLSSQQTNMARG